MLLFNKLVDSQPIVEELIITVLLGVHCITCTVSMIMDRRTEDGGLVAE